VNITGLYQHLLQTPATQNGCVLTKRFSYYVAKCDTLSPPISASEEEFSRQTDG